MMRVNYGIDEINVIIGFQSERLSNNLSEDSSGFYKYFHFLFVVVLSNFF